MTRAAVALRVAQSRRIEAYAAAANLAVHLNDDRDWKVGRPGVLTGSLNLPEAVANAIDRIAHIQVADLDDRDHEARERPGDGR